MGLPLVDAQRGMDGRWYEPPTKAPEGPRDCPTVDAPAPRAALPLLPLPGLFTVPPQVDLFEQRWEKPAKGAAGEVEATYEDRTEWQRKMWGWARDSARDHNSKSYAHRRAEQVGTCGKEWVTERTCTDCGGVDESVVHPMDTCNSRGCLICAPARSKIIKKNLAAYREKHKPQRTHGAHNKVSRNYFFHTITIPVPPDVSLPGFRTMFSTAKKALKVLFGKDRKGHMGLLTLLPRRPGEEQTDAACPDWGGFASIEVGPHGNLHIHVLRYGAFHRSEDIRAALAHLGIKWTFDKCIRTGKDFTGAVAEVAKYMTKGSTKPGRTRSTHPLVSVLAELALAGCKLYRTFGNMSGLTEVDATIDEMQAEEDRRWSCPHCGGTHGEDVITHFDKPCIPPGWRRKRKRPPGETNRRQT